MPIPSQIQLAPSRALPSPVQEGINQLVNARAGRYGETYASLIVPTKHVLADQGSYFTTNNNQTGIATSATPTSFSSTNPFLTIYNTAQANNPLSPRIYLDYATLLATAAGTAGASVQVAIALDAGNRYTSGGTALTPIKTNSAGPGSVAQIYAGNITAGAASGYVRYPVGNRYMKGAIPVAGDQYTLAFGSVDAPATFAISTILFSTQPVPPVVINPGETALIHIWLPSQSGASSYAPELGWWEL
jgi:hypothetical protein